jgi:hypothetical protein
MDGPVYCPTGEDQEVALQPPIALRDSLRQWLTSLVTSRHVVGALSHEPPAGGEFASRINVSLMKGCKSVTQ